MSAVNDMKAESFARGGMPAIAGKDDEIDIAGERFGVFPMWQCLPLVGSHDPEEPGIGCLSGNCLGGKIGERGARRVYFAIIDSGPWDALYGEL